MASRETALRATAGVAGESSAGAATAGLVGVKSDSIAGTAAAPPRSRSQRTMNLPCTAGPIAPNAEAKAGAAVAMVIRPKPDACIRALIDSSAAMPTPPHGPHCTDEEARPTARRSALVASRQQLAAE